MTREAMFDELVDSILTFDAEKVMESTKKALNLGMSPLEIIDGGLTKGLRLVGKKFEDGELFLMHLVAAAEAVKKTINEVLEPKMLNLKEERKSIGKIVIGTVSGDIHDIGKSIVSAMLFAERFEVFDLGKDVPTEEFVRKVKEVNADVVGLSALLSTTLPQQHDVIRALAREGLRDKVKVIVGGAPVTEEWAEEIGADGYGENATEAVKVVKRLLDISA